MTIHFTVGVYCVRSDDDPDEEWTALTPALFPAYVSGTGEIRLRDRMTDRLRDVLRKAPPTAQELFQVPLGTELLRLPIDVKLDNGTLHGQVPLIVEPRWVSEHVQRLFAYHPLFRTQWLIADDRDELVALAPSFFRHHFADASEDDLEEMTSNGRDRLIQVAFSTEPRSLLDQLPSRTEKPRAAGARGRAQNVLHQLGVDETRLATGGKVRTGVPRSPYRERLAYLLGGPRPRSVAVVGPPGAGKTTLIRQWIADRLVEDGFPIHKNLDRAHHVWRLSGKRLIAGMSYLGQWEERCLAVLEEAHKRRGILWFDDLHLFGRLGQSRQSERSFADFFRGPIRRGDLAVVAELSPEQLARLERDAPALAEALAPVVVPAASAAETAQLLLHEIRDIETQHPVSMHPFVPRTALELGAALFPWRARPGVAIEIVRRVADRGASRPEAHVKPEVTPHDVLDYLARTTGLSPKLISLEEVLEPDEVEAAFAARVIGQPVATRAATDVILRVRAGLADPARPVGVMLFTGPTGTGKTELATAIAEYLYGGADADHAATGTPRGLDRLLRIDMGELSGPDAVARLIGDRWNTEGLLTSRVRAQPFCVVLLDEIEKAHPQALHLLLQLFDEGRLTDANGEVASFASAVVIMTSNLGSKNAAPIGFGETRDRILADVAKAVREFFPVELFNRIDQVVPFEPLTPEVAARVVDKELAKLLARRGLRERNTFVYAGAAVRRRAISDAFDPRYGARTVKRWLEDRVGGVLTDLLATAKPARLRIVRLAEHDGQIEATLEPMAERPPTPGPYLLDGALDLATAALDPAIEAARDALDRVRRSDVLARARASATGELRYYVDELTQRVQGLGELFGAPVQRADRHDHDDDPARTHRARVIARRTRPPASRDALLAGIAEAVLIERALPDLLDPDAHAVTVKIHRSGTTAEAHGIRIVTLALAQPAWLDGSATVDARGKLVALPAPGALATAPALATARDVVLVLRGLFVRAALDGEHGTWMIRAAAAEPDVIRVEVCAGATAEPAAVLRDHLAARARLEHVLEHGGPMPPNPDVLLPVTRALTYRPPLRPGEAFGVELEDFSTGWVDRSAARDLSTAIRRAWHLSWSRLPQRGAP